MNRTYSKIASFCAAGGLFLAAVSPAFASRLYVTPLSQSIDLGSVQKADIRLDTQGESINAVSANFTFPSALLEVASISHSSSFGIEAEQKVSGNVITIDLGNITPVSGDVAVATVTFKAIKIGAGSIAFKGDSAVVKASDNTNSLTVTQGSTVSVASKKVLSAQTARVQTTSVSSLALVLTFLQNVKNTFF